MRKVIHEQNENIKQTNYERMKEILELQNTTAY